MPDPLLPALPLEAERSTSELPCETERRLLDCASASMPEAPLRGGAMLDCWGPGWRARPFMAEAMAVDEQLPREREARLWPLLVSAGAACALSPESRS